MIIALIFVAIVFWGVFGFALLFGAMSLGASLVVALVATIAYIAAVNYWENIP